MLIVDTPLSESLPAIGARESGIDPALFPAMVGDPGQLKKLEDPRAVVVTTGQQPGLFTGPLYTIHKAVSARALAQELEQVWGRPVVPVFWNASDDHDFAEASIAQWIGQDGSLQTGRLAPRPADAPLRSMSLEPLTPEIDDLLDRIAAAFPEGSGREETMAWLRRHYRVGAMLGSASAGALAELLVPLGIVLFDPSVAAAKKASVAILVEALARGKELNDLLAARVGELAMLGIDPGIEIDPAAGLVFVDGSAGRDRLLFADGEYRLRRSREVMTMAEVERLANESPERLSANVLLRPVVESALLPTVAYVGGPGELKYLALAETLYSALEVPRQTPVPRWSGLLVEPRVTRATEKLDCSIAELLGPTGIIEERLARRFMPPDFTEAFAKAVADLDRDSARLVELAQVIDPTMLKAAETAKASAIGSIRELERRLLQAQKRRQAEVFSQLERARTAVQPGGGKQERTLCLPSFTGRYGLGMVTELADHVTRWYQERKVDLVEAAS